MTGVIWNSYCSYINIHIDGYFVFEGAYPLQEKPRKAFRSFSFIKENYKSEATLIIRIALSQ